MAIGQKIMEARKEKKLSRAALASLIDASPGAIKDWENGKYAPNADKICSLMHALDKDANYFLADQYSRMAEETEEDRKRRLKLSDLDPWEIRIVDGVIDSILTSHYEREDAMQEAEEIPDEYINVDYYSSNRPSAGLGNMMFEDADPTPLKVKKTRISSRASFAVKIDGRSMEPRFKDGDIVLVSQNDMPQNGEIGIFLDLDTNEVFIKMKKENMLYSLNRAYPDIPVTGEMYCYGKVLGKAEL